jgi:hypothetical protein
VGLGCWHFQFAWCVIEFDLTIGERVYVDHHMIQLRNCRIDCEGSFDFHNQQKNGRDVQPTKNRHHQIIGQADQGEGKRKRTWPFTRKLFHWKHLSIKKDQRFPFSRECMQLDYQH